MKNNLTRAAIGLAAVIQLAAVMPVSAADAPAFIEVGKRYTLTIPINSQLVENQFKVLEIIKDGWVKVAMLQGNQVMWLNTNQALLIAPFPQQPAE
jgi:hypothetical protein